MEANEWRSGNIAALAKKREIVIKGRHSAYTDENWNILAEVIRTTTSLKTLSFNRDAVIALQNDEVVDALAKNRTIKTLDLMSADCGDEGAKAVAAILKENSTIVVVNLNKNQIGVDGAKAIAASLEENPSLRVLCIGRNSIGDEGAKAIADSLKENHSLQELSILSNSIGDEGAKAIADALKENHSLQELFIGRNSIGVEGGKQLLNALQQIDSSAIDVISLRGNQISEETLTKIEEEVIRIHNRFKSVGSNQGQVVSVATAAGESQGVQNERSSSNEDEGMPTIHTPNVSRGGSAENVQETNQTGHNTIAMETKIKEQQSNIAQLQGKIAEQDKEIASMKDIMKTIGDMVNGRHGDTTSNISNASIPERETELQSEIERYKQEIDSLKEQLKNSRPIETVDLTNEIDPGSSSGGEDSNEEEPPSKRRRMKSNLAVALEQTQQLVQVKEEAKERAAVAEANVASARREKDAVEASLRDVQEDLEDSNELVTQQTLTTDIWQGRFDELFELARAAGVDGNALSEIRYRPLSSGR